MKKIFLVAAFALTLFSCKTSSVTATKLDRGTQVGMKGNWVISSVTYPGSNYIKVNSFQLADSKCFEGSTWKFISNNNKGEMALTKYDCPVFSSPITWFVNSNGEVVLKILDAGEKARKVRDGYVLRVANLTEGSFQLIDKIDVGGKLTDVVYQFQRVN
ncbi:lipocalin family protein [Flavobacterium nitratireducens]|uniref:lipocalin family protein n=1 Tax=Flavobacterium nitratireducens TaxID=992289 RepID=UPI0024154FB8|nr:lipocalin family protein [Flavobacterium nitratireducens]